MPPLDHVVAGLLQGVGLGQGQQGVDHAVRHCRCAVLRYYQSLRHAAAR